MLKLTENNNLGANRPHAKLPAPCPRTVFSAERRESVFIATWDLQTHVSARALAAAAVEGRAGPSSPPKGLLPGVFRAVACG